MEKDITIYDIARELNLSPTTVSRALNDHPAVNQKTKQRISEAAARMGYRSNLFASNLRKQHTNTIGVIVPRLNSPFMSSVLSGMEKVANDAGYNLIISQSLETLQKEIANAKTMFNSRVDGVLVSLSYETENLDHFQSIINKGIPVIFYDRVAEHPSCTSIVIDNLQAAYQATSHLIEQGCTNIVHITGNLNRNVYSDRLKGYKYALVDHDLPYDDRNIMINNLSEEAGEEAARKILAMNPMPDGVFVSNDTCAVSCLKTLKQAGVSVPKDIAIAGFNNDAISRVVEPNLTTVNYPGQEMGEVAVRVLLMQMSGTVEGIPSNTINLRSELIIRESSVRSKVGNTKKKAVLS
ncbi:LacI family DNA-binding transcriptional regulator [Rufibacter glacialis]|uniref:LacI family DNA-binding transcriptional regulator n=1 Tax=Rufibacter glacialis TaxID=1259555 RepID=A0A5M8QCE6_9BACT|nr:LacI family DNA-binding transcriptional regulator [Rufibacter glacialis]KAA6432486.1 LacI family transcriptional regulator [Rufibacter glacialis]GGK79076.1 LacI family transcriptional regulator [Rufibacter glacialis]